MGSRVPGLKGTLVSLSRNNKDIILFQAICALLSDLPQTNEVTRARKGVDLAIEELTMEEE